MIFKDLKSFIAELKRNYRRFNKLQVTSLELDKLNSKVVQFYQNSFEFSEDK